jgi:hypothetical protein
MFVAQAIFTLEYQQKKTERENVWNN